MTTNAPPAASQAPPRTRVAGTSRGGSSRFAPPVHRRRRWPWWLALALVVAALAGGGYVAYRTPVLGLRAVTVAGASSAMAKEVQGVLGVPADTPLLTVDLAAVRRRILALPDIAGASVARRWPHTLAVVVRVRVPVAVTQADGRWFLLDASGTPYRAVAAPPAALLNVQLATPGAGDPSTRAGIAVAAELPAAVRRLVRSVRAASAFRVELLISGGRTVIWGTPGQAAAKAAALALVLQRPGTTFDVSDPGLVTVR